MSKRAPHPEAWLAFFNHFLKKEEAHQTIALQKACPRKMSKQKEDVAGLRLFFRQLLEDTQEGGELVEKARAACPGVPQVTKKMALESDGCALTAQQRRWLESHVRSNLDASNYCLDAYPPTPLAQWLKYCGAKLVPPHPSLCFPSRISDLPVKCALKVFSPPARTSI